MKSLIVIQKSQLMKWCSCVKMLTLIIIKKSKYAEYKAAGYSDVNIFNKYYAWDSDAPFTAYFSSQAYKDYSLELLVRSEVKNHHRSWDFVQRWKNGSNWRALSSLDPDDTDEAVAADIILLILDQKLS